jgi:hypothetical protein
MSFTSKYTKKTKSVKVKSMKKENSIENSKLSCSSSGNNYENGKAEFLSKTKIKKEKNHKLTKLTSRCGPTI